VDPRRELGIRPASDQPSKSTAEHRPMFVQVSGSFLHRKLDGEAAGRTVRSEPIPKGAERKNSVQDANKMGVGLKPPKNGGMVTEKYRNKSRDLCKNKKSQNEKD